jgi:prevent-host-death family protein
MTMRLADTEQRLSEVVDRVARGEARVVVEQGGSPLAVIISVEEYRRFKAAEAQREARFAAMSRISESFADVPLEELEQQATKAVADARTELRAERDHTPAS